MLNRMFSSTWTLLLLGSLICLGCKPQLLLRNQWQRNLSESSAEKENEDAEGDSEATESDSDSPKAEEGETPPSAELLKPPAALLQAEWILRVSPPGETLPPDALTWRHAKLEEVLALPAEQQPAFATWLEHEDGLIAGNAAIAAARQMTASTRTASPDVESSAETSLITALISTARNTELKMPQRRAAVETLGTFKAPAARLAIIELMQQYGDFAGDQRHVYNEELHIELIAALSRTPDDQARELLIPAMLSRSVNVQLAAIKAWPAEASFEVPEPLLALAQAPDPRVRVACLKLLAECQAPQAFTLARRALNDVRYEVRLAAVEAMGELTNEEAGEELAKLIRHPHDRLRAAAVHGLAKQGDWRTALTAVEDETWQVRLALAEELAHLSTVESAQIAEKLLSDRSTDVQKQTVQAIAAWPWPRGGQLLLAALDSRVFQTREEAAKLLGEHWAAAATFPYQAEPEARVKALLELQEKWGAEFPGEQLSTSNTASHSSSGSSNSASKTLSAAIYKQVAADIRLLNDPTSGQSVKQATCQRLTAHGENLSPALAELISVQKTTLPPEVYASVLPNVDENFALLSKLETAELTIRRQAASELRQSGSKSSLSDLAMLRLAELIVPEEDAVIWHEVQQLLQDDPREPAVRIQYAALNHPVPEVQRRACVYLGQHGEARHAAVLTAALEDNNVVVVTAAAEALGQLEELDNTLPLVRLLASRDRQVVLAASMSLARQGEESGGDGLERLALDSDSRIRRKVISTMGELRQARFIPSLMKALDDQLGIKQSALDGLTATVGKNIGQGSDQNPSPMAEQIHRWRQWYLQQEQARISSGQRR